MMDQAARLREIARKRNEHQPQWKEGKAHYIAVASAKGGVGKSFLTLALGELYARNGANVLVIDANLNTPSLHVLTNVNPRFSVRDMLAYRVDDNQIWFSMVSERLQLLANEAPENQMARGTLDNAIFFLEQIRNFRRVFDVILFDTHTGLDSWNLSVLQAAQTVLLVTTPEPTAIIDTYLLVKAASEFMSLDTIQLVVNQALIREQGQEAAEKLNMALGHFLQVQLPLVGTAIFDLSIRQIMQEQAFPYLPLLKKTRFLTHLQEIWNALPATATIQNKEVAI